jgi:hypothetical protein
MKFPSIVTLTKDGVNFSLTPNDKNGLNIDFQEEEGGDLVACMKDFTGKLRISPSMVAHEQPALSNYSGDTSLKILSSPPASLKKEDKDDEELVRESLYSPFKDDNNGNEEASNTDSDASDEFSPPILKKNTSHKEDGLDTDSNASDEFQQTQDQYEGLGY